MIRYIINTRPTVRLSCEGQWGNLPFPTVEAAKAHAASLPAPAGHTIAIDPPKGRK